MDQQEELATNIPPLFRGENYAYWRVRMKCHLMSLGWKVWETNEKEYKIDDQEPIDGVDLANMKVMPKS